jgi:hypothetical protein
MVVFVAGDLAAWLTRLLADRVRRELTVLVLGDELDRVLGDSAHFPGRCQRRSRTFVMSGHNVRPFSAATGWVRPEAFRGGEHR